MNGPPRTSRKRSPDRLKKIRIFKGHMTFGLHESFRSQRRILPFCESLSTA